MRRRSPPRGRALRRSPCSPFRVPGRKVCYRGWVCSATFRSCSVVSPEGWPEPRHWQRSRKRVSGARLRGASAHSSSPPASWEGRPADGAARAVRGRATGTDGASRSRSAGVGHGGARRSSGEPPRVGPPRSRRARSAASSVRQIHTRCRRGPCQRRASSAIRSVGVGWSHLSVRVRSSGRRRRGATDRAVRPTRRRSRATLARAIPGTRRFSYPGWEKLENRSGEFFKERRGERSQGRPLAPRPPPGSEGGSADAGLPHRGPLSFPYTRWHWCPPDSGSFSPPRGEGGESHLPP